MCPTGGGSASEITQFSGFVKIVVRLFANVPMMGFIPLREIHRASECALQGLLRPIDSRGEAKLNCTPKVGHKNQTKCHEE